MVSENSLNKLKEQIKLSQCDGLIITSLSWITYFTNYPNFSNEERETFLFISPTNQYILTDARYSEAIEKGVKGFKLLEISAKNPVKSIFESLIKKHEIKILGVEENNISVSEYKFLKKIFQKIKLFKIVGLRNIKSSQEIEKIKKACQIGDMAFNFVIKNIRSGTSEQEIAYLIEDFIRKNNAKPSFDTIVAIGKNASIPHHFTGNKKLTSKKNGQFIKMDFGVKFDNYCSDMTRTIFFGNPSKVQIRIYQTVKKAQQKAADFINKSLEKNLNQKLLASDVDKIARNFIQESGFGSIPHALGHGIGIQVHEPPALTPSSKDLLTEGMVFSIEPGIYLKNYGGVRIEDLYAIQNGSLIQLTQSTKDLIII